MSTRCIVSIALAAVTAAASALAQAPPVPPVPRPPASPNPNATPAPEATKGPGPGVPQSYDEWAKIYFKVLRLPKDEFIEIGPNLVKSIKLFTNHVWEVVGEEGDDYLVRNLPPEDPRSYGYRGFVLGQQRLKFAEGQADYYADKYDITDLEEIYPPFTDVLEFTSKSEGLPRQGKWQMSFDVADINGDGRLDLVFPPVRTGYAYPVLFLQQKDGSWKAWRDVKWPSGVAFDYGAVRVADFDMDGNPDIALACHFKASFVVYGNGKGDFSRYVQLPRPNQRVTSRSLTVADFNGDGRPDLAQMAEVAVEIGSSQRITDGLVWVLLNRESGWKVVSEGLPDNIQGDWLRGGDLDGDGAADLLLTTRMRSQRDLIWRNSGDGEHFELVAELEMPVSSYIFANSLGDFSGGGRHDLLLCFEQFNWKHVEPPSQACGIFRFHDASGKFTPKPKPTLFLKREVDYVNNLAVAVGDLNGDGLDDVAILNYNGEVRTFIQFPDHTLYEERSPEISTGGASVFDIKIRDLDGDGLGEVIVCGSDRKSATGGIWVFSPHRKAS